MTILSHQVCAELLFTSGQAPEDTIAAARLIARQYRSDPDLGHTAQAVALEYGEHWETAHERMSRCLRVAPRSVVVPDVLPPGVLELIGCERDECTSSGPFEAVANRLYCLRHAATARLAEALLGESAGDDDEMEVISRG